MLQSLHPPPQAHARTVGCRGPASPGAAVGYCFSRRRQKASAGRKEAPSLQAGGGGGRGGRPSAQGWPRTTSGPARERPLLSRSPVPLSAALATERGCGESTQEMRIIPVQLKSRGARVHWRRCMRGSGRGGPRKPYNEEKGA